MKKIILLTLLSLFLACCADDVQHTPHQWVCFKSAPTFDKIKIKPEEANYIPQNEEEKVALEQMIQEKWDFKSEPKTWTVHSRCIKVTWKDSQWKTSKKSH